MTVTAPSGVIPVNEHCSKKKAMISSILDVLTKYSCHISARDIDHYTNVLVVIRVLFHCNAMTDRSANSRFEVIFAIIKPNQLFSILAPFG